MFSETWKHEAEIVSNRKLVCYGETKVKPCTHCPSRLENILVFINFIFLVFFNYNNLFRNTIYKIHESSFAISFVLLILALGSVFNGYLFKDLFLGVGNLFLITNINPILNFRLYMV